MFFVFFFLFCYPKMSFNFREIRKILNIFENNKNCTNRSDNNRKNFTDLPPTHKPIKLIKSLTWNSVFHTAVWRKLPTNCGFSSICSYIIHSIALKRVIYTISWYFRYSSTMRALSSSFPSLLGTESPNMAIHYLVWGGTS